MDNELFLSVVIPAFNEAANLPSTLADIIFYLTHQKFSYEVIVVDDGSTDRTCAIVEQYIPSFPQLRLLKNGTNQGKGFSVQKGILACSGRYLLFLDADNSTSIRELDTFLPFLEQGYDMVIASRRIRGAHIEVPQPFLRTFLGSIYILLSKILINSSVSDFNCGFKAFKRDPAKCIFSKLRMHDWSFDVELLLLAKKYRLKIKESPVHWKHHATSKVKPFKDSIRSFLSLLSIKIDELTGKYDR